MVLMTGAVTGTVLARPWAVAVAAAVAILPLRMMITTIAAVLPVATALDATITADARPRVSSMTDVKEDMDVPRLVAEWRLMSMAHRARATLTILTMPGPAHHPVAMTTRTSMVEVVRMREEDVLHLRVALAHVAQEAVPLTMPLPSTHLAAVISNCALSHFAV